MSAKDTQESVITLPESEGVIRDLMQKLAGKRARLWFSALKRFLQKENPWIGIDQIAWIPRNYGDTAPAIQSFSILKKARMNFFAYWDKVFATDSEVQFDVVPDGYDFIPPHHIVSVRLGDLLDINQAKKIDYEELLEIAYREHDLLPCDIRNGLYAIRILASRAKNENFGSASHHNVICTEPIKSHKPRTIPLFRIYNGNHDEPGSVMLMSVDPLDASPEGKADISMLFNNYLSPDSRLIFRQIAT